jgi:hypothetical protein
MVVQNSVTQIGGHGGRSKALNHIRSGQHLLVSSSKMARHMSSVHHNWSLLKSDRFSLQTTLPVSIMVGPLTLEVHHLGFTTPLPTPPHRPTHSAKRLLVCSGTVSYAG